MKHLLRIFLALLFSAALYTPLAWADDEHFDFVPEDQLPVVDSEDLENSTFPLSPLEIPAVSHKPPVPLVFAESSEILKNWKMSEKLPPNGPKSPEPARSLASVPDETRTLTQRALDHEGQFQDQVMEASIGEIPATYKKILSIFHTGRITPRPIKDKE